MKLVDIDELNYGKIICSCELIDCVEMTDDFIEKVKNNRFEYIIGVYVKERYAWILNNIKILDNPIETKGYLGIWDYIKLVNNLL